MSEGVQIAAFLLVAGAIATIAKLLWDHVQHCKEVHGKLAEISGDVKRLMQDIGTHDTGIRGAVHKAANRIIEHEGRLMSLERRQESER